MWIDKKVYECEWIKQVMNMDWWRKFGSCVVYEWIKFRKKQTLTRLISKQQQQEGGGPGGRGGKNIKTRKKQNYFLCLPNWYKNSSIELLFLNASSKMSKWDYAVHRKNLVFNFFVQTFSDHHRPSFVLLLQASSVLLINYYSLFYLFFHFHIKSFYLFPLNPSFFPCSNLFILVFLLLKQSIK